jgi:hypothetical protein
MLFHIYKIFFICELLEDAPTPGVETGGAAFCRDKFLELSISRALDYQIDRMFEHAKSQELPTEFD